MHVDPSDLYPRAQEQALAWNRDARLVSISAAPVVRDKVEFTGPEGESSISSSRPSIARKREGGA